MSSMEELNMFATNIAFAMHEAIQCQVSDLPLDTIFLSRMPPTSLLARCA